MKKRYLVPILLLVYAGYMCLMFPVIVKLWARYSQTTRISGYAATIDQTSQEEREEEMKRDMDYNAALFEHQRVHPFRYHGEEKSDELYESLLSDSPSMCTLEIPRIDTSLTVSHGTKSNELQFEAGHFYGTSLPVGGPSTHCGIAAHSALPRADLFTNLELLEEGDEFFIHVLGETHAYIVKDIKVVLPEEADLHMQIEEGKDLVTLYTCTPYGINSHRLLVTGERTTDPVKESSTPLTTVAKTRSTRTMMLLTAIIFAPMMLSIVIIVANECKILQLKK